MRTYMVVTVNPLDTCPKDDGAVGSLYQYDYGQRVAIGGVDLPAAYEVHFSNKKLGESVTVIGDETGVDIPDEMLLTGQDIHLWLYLHQGEDDGETVWYARIAVKERAKPTHEQPTPVQQDEITQAIAALNAAVESTEEDAAAAEASAQRAEAAEAAAEAAQNLAETAQGAAEAAQTGAEAAMRAAEAAQTGAETADVAAEEAQAAAEGARDRAEAAAELLENPGAEAETLEPGSSATASYSEGVFTFGIPAGVKGDTGKKGDDGFSPEVSVSKSGTTATVTVTDASGTTTAEIHDGADGKDGKDGKDGADGISPAASVSKSGTTATITITDRDGTTTATVTDGTDGQDGQDGQDGYTPQRGTDYWTAADKEEIVAEAEAEFSEDISDITTELSAVKSDLDSKAPVILQTASGDIVTITDGADGMPLSAVVQIDPVQDTSGGDPSPSHICPISGWTGCTVTVANGDDPTATGYSATEYPVSWQTAAGTVYGGTVDYAAKKLTMEWVKLAITDAHVNYNNSGTTDTGTWANYRITKANAQYEWYAVTPNAGDNNGFFNIGLWRYSSVTGVPRAYAQSGYIYFVVVTDDPTYNLTTEAGRNAWIASLSEVPAVWYRIKTPVVYDLSDVPEITTLKGNNTIWADCGPITVEYPADTKAYIAEVTDPDANVITVSGSTPTITGVSGKRYVCGTVDSISITPPQTGIIDVVFASGTTPTVLTVPSSVKFPAWFDATALDASTTYEINIMDGYGAVSKWT